MNTLFPRALVALVLLFAFYTPAQAAFIDNVDSFTDTDTGFTWLKPSQTLGMSYDEAVAFVSGASDRPFRPATLDEVEVLMLNAGWTGAFDALNQANPNTFLASLEVQWYDSFVSGAAAGLLMDADNPPTTPPIIIRIHAETAGYTSWNPLGPTTPNFSDADTWVAMVQVVPIPGAVWLFGSGLFALVGFARRRQAA